MQWPSQRGKLCTRSGSPKGSYALPVALVVALYIGIGFITAMNDVLVLHFKDLFQLSNVRALLVHFAFFGAYFLLAVPSSRIGYKNGIIAAMCAIGVGLLLFLPASLIISYRFSSLRSSSSALVTMVVVRSAIPRPN